MRSAVCVGRDACGCAQVAAAGRRRNGGRTPLTPLAHMQAAEQIPDGSLDYVYVDARHDYCGVKEDITV